MKKIITIAIFALLLMSAPTQAKAFDIEDIIDPFCLWSCDDEPAVVNTTNTNSNNVNSNINSPNSNVVSGTPVTTPIVITTPVYAYDNNYNYDYDNNSPLGVSCYSTSSSANVDDLVTWRASVYGGNGNYHVSWSGTNGLSGNGTSASIRYRTDGTKNASVNITSGNQSISRNCSSMEVYDYNDNYNNNNNYNYNYNDDYNYNNNSQLYITCSANVTFAPVGTRVTWQAYVSGGNGNYSYRWYGTDNTSGSGRSLDLFYNNPGTKSASVTVKSGSRSYSQLCSNTVLVGAPINQYTNPYPTYTPPTTVIKYVPAPVKEVVKAPVVEQAALVSFAAVPWGCVAVLIILILLFTVIYLVFTRNKIS